jgi:putative flippase GtrA
MKIKIRAFRDKYFDYSMLRWGLVGITTTSIDFILFITIFKINQSVFIANLISVGLATTLNYLSHHRWTFKSDQNHSKSGIRYILNLIFWWIISTSIIKTLVELDLDPRIAKIIPLIFIVPVNYFVLNSLVFKRSQSNSN